MNAEITDEILRLETAFWDAMLNRDGETVASLTSAPSMIANSAGVAAIDPATVAAILTSSNWSLDSYSFEDVKFRVLDPDSVVIGYKVTERLTMDGRPMELTAFDTSLWRRENGRWTCALHTESLAGDAFGRDKGEATA